MNENCHIVGPVFLDYQDTLTRYVASKVPNTMDQEDLLAQVLLKVYDSCEKLSQVKNTQAWLITIARNTIHDYFRELNKNGRDVMPEDLEDVVDEDFFTELSHCVLPLIKKLPSKYSGPLTDYEVLGIPQKDLSVKYGLSNSGLKSRIQRGRQMMKSLFTEYCLHLITDQEDCSECSC